MERLIISDRIRKAMNLRGLSQADIVSKTDIPKSSLSSYLSGKYLPKQTNIYKIANCLNVSEEWLMGYNVPMEKEYYTNNIELSTNAFYKFKQKIDFLMKKNKIENLKVLSEKIEVSFEELSNAYYKNNINYTTLKKLANYFNILIDFFLDERIAINNMSVAAMGAYFEDLITDLNNLELIEENMFKKDFDFLELDYEYSPSSKEETDFGMNSYSRIWELYEQLISMDLVKKGHLLSKKELNNIKKVIHNNLNLFKEKLDETKNEHLVQWKKFTKSKYYKDYVKETASYEKKK